MYYNLICIFICTPICTKKIILVKSGCYIWYLEYHISWTRWKGAAGPSTSQPTWPKDTVQEALNRGGLEDRYRIKYGELGKKRESSGHIQSYLTGSFM
jgi:hypothetical protein